MEVHTVKESKSDKYIKITEILDLGHNNRKDLAEALNISLSGINNLLSDLKVFGVIREYQVKSPSAGRRSTNICLRSEPVFAVARIFPDKIVTSFFGFNLSISDTFSQSFTDPLFIDDCLISYFRMLYNSFPKLRQLYITADSLSDGNSFYGCANRNLDGLPIADMASEFMKNTIITLENQSRFIPDETDGMNAVISEYCGSVSVALIYNGKQISDKVRAIGEMTDRDGRVFNIRIKYSAMVDDYVTVLASLIDEIISLVKIDRIYFSSDRYRSAMIVTNEIVSHLILEYGHNHITLPRFITVAHDTVAPDRLRRHIREGFIRSVICE